MSSTKFVNRGGFVMGEVPAGPFWIEYQHSLESTQAEKIPTFALTRDELLLLVKYAYSEILDIDWRWFCSRRSRTDWRRAAQFGYRLASFETILGQGAVNQVIEEVRESFRRSLQSYQDQETWRIFTEGEPWEREGLAAESWRVLEENAEKLRKQRKQYDVAPD